MKNKTALLAGTLAIVVIIGTLYVTNVNQSEVASTDATLAAATLPTFSKPPFCYEFTREMKFGDNSQEVFTLNKALIALKLLDGTPVRTFTADTRRAVVEFQQIKGINPPAGTVGNRTRTALNEIFSCTVPPTTQKPTVQLFHPNGTEPFANYTHGDTINVIAYTYNLTPDVKNIDVFLRFTTSGELCFLGNIPANQTQFSARIERTMTCGGSTNREIVPGNYEILVELNNKSYATGNAGPRIFYDFSDKPFKISAPAGQNNKIDGFRFVSAYNGETIHNIKPSATSFQYQQRSPNTQIAFITDAGPDIQSVRYEVTIPSGKKCAVGAVNRLEKVRPFTLGGNTGNTYAVWKPKPDDVCTITVTSYSDANGKNKVESKTLDVTFIKKY